MDCKIFPYIWKGTFFFSEIKWCMFIIMFKNKEKDTFRLFLFFPFISNVAVNLQVTLCLGLCESLLISSQPYLCSLPETGSPHCSVHLPAFPFNLNPWLPYYRFLLLQFVSPFLPLYAQVNYSDLQCLLQRSSYGEQPCTLPSLHGESS